MTEWKDERKKAVQRKRTIPQMPEGYYSGGEMLHIYFKKSFVKEISKM